MLASVRRSLVVLGVCVAALLAGPWASAWATGLADGVTWTTRASASDNGWHDIAYGNGLFVALAYGSDSNLVMTSPDGVTWTARSVPVANAWLGIEYGNGRFVAVAQSGFGNRAMTSTDGINWTMGSGIIGNNWRELAYGNGLFVAISYIGSGNQVMTSPDGLTWTVRATPGSQSWMSVTYGNGLFVAVGESGTANRVMTSPDGITWTSRSTAGADNNWWDVTYGNGLFVAVAQSGVGNRVMTSPDGITWTIRSTPADNMWRSVTYGNGLFVAVAWTGAGNRVMTSPDGITWTAQSSAANNQWLAVEYAHGVFVAVADTGTGNRVMTNGTFDATAPDVASIASGPAAGSAVPGPASVSFGFSATDALGGSGVVAYRCRLDGPAGVGTWGGCSSPRSYSALADGQYTFSVRAVDGVGLEGPVASRSFEVFSGVPDTRVDTTVPAFVSAAGVALSFTADQAGATFRCRVDNGAWNACASGDFFTLDEGIHSISVQAVSRAGVADPEPAIVSTVIDRTAPSVEVQESSVSAGASTADPGFRVRLRTNESGARFECRLDDGVWKDCESQTRYDGLAAGKHTFAARAIDRAGNVGASAQKSWSVKGARVPLVVAPVAQTRKVVCDDAELTGVQSVQYQWRRDSTTLSTTSGRYTPTDRDSGSRLTCTANVTFASGVQAKYTAPAILVDGATRLTKFAVTQSTRRGPLATYTLNRDHVVLVRLWCRSATSACAPPSKPTDFVKPARASYVPAGLVKYRRIAIDARKGTNTLRLNDYLPKGLPKGEYKVTIRLARRSTAGRLTTTNFTHQDLRVTNAAKR